jgi:hypothetical protein
MKKLLAIISIIILMNILSAEVCWENGVPLYEGNFIYREKSTVTPLGNIYITWVELDNSYRKLKLQKTNSVGEPIWVEPVTIDQNEQFILETNIVESGNDGCFINAFYQNRSNQKLYKIDNNGNVLWQSSHNSSYAINLLPVNNGGIILSEINDIDNIYYLQCRYINDSGTILWENEQLYNFQSWNSEDILEQQYVDGFFYFLLSEGNNCFIIKVNEEGELLSQSNPFSIGYYNSAKYINNSFFVFYLNPDTHDLEMHNFDLEGNSIWIEDTRIICNTYGWKADDFTFSENYFYAILTNANENLVFHKCNFEGEILNTFTHNDEITYYNLQVYDQEVDFVSCFGYSPTFDAYLLTLNETGISEPIHYLPENSTNYWGEKYFLDDNFSFAGYCNTGDKEIYTMRKTEDTTIVNTIQDIEYEIIRPKLEMKNSNLAAFWSSYENNGIMIQEYDVNGNPQYSVNGDVLIEGYNNFFIIEDKIITIDDTLTNLNNIMNCYDFDGEHLWSEQFAGALSDHHIYPFYDGYLFICKEIIHDPTQHILKCIAFDENGLLWTESVTLEMTEPVTFGDIKMKGNVLFFRSYHTVYRVSINSNGTYTQPQTLAGNSDMIFTYGDENKFFAVTRDGTTSFREFHYFQDGNLIWDDTWDVYIGDYGNLHTFFEEDGFYLIGFNYPDSVNIDKFDYDHNLIEESSFDYTSQNPIIGGFDIYKQSGKFIFVFNSMLSNYDHQFSYMITDSIGNILVPEFAETIMERDNLEFSHNTLFSNNCLYMPIACGYKPFEGEYERNYYIQKIDLSDYVKIENEIISITDTKLTCYPNPFNPSTTINFSVQKECYVELSIYNIKGQKVKNLVNSDLEAGNHSVIWLGSDETGKSVSSGVYFYKLKAGDFQKVRKMILIK